MKKTNALARLLEILDGSPAVHRKAGTSAGRDRRWRGQSLVEMAFITPLLLLLFAGLVEIGWLANNYLNLLDVTRYGARYATTLSDERVPLSWDNRSSYVPNDYVPNLYEQSYSSAAEAASENFARLRERETWAVAFDTNPTNPPTSATASACADPASFYADVACRILISMPPMRTSGPMRLNPYNGVDDIIISAFSLELVDVPLDDDPTDATDRWSDPATRPIADPVPQLLVVGRYPSNANECQAAPNGSLDPDIFDPRDPFDLNNNGLIDTRSATTAAANPATHNLNDFSEVLGFDANTGTRTIISDGDPLDPMDDVAESTIEKQVGFQWYGNHVIEGTGCIGSEWTISEIENLFNLPSYAITDAGARRMLPSQGVVLVEMYWEHEMLLQIPVLSPVFEAFSRDGRPDLYLWAMFPLPSVDPYIEFVIP